MAELTTAQSDKFQYEFRPPADSPIGLLERPEQPTVERPSVPLKATPTCSSVSKTEQGHGTSTTPDAVEGDLPA